MLFGDFARQLELKAANARRVILLWSPRAALSKHVFFEGVLAANRGTLAPIIIEKDINHPLPENWSRFHYLELIDFERQKADIVGMLPPPSGKRERLSSPDNDRVCIAGLPTAGGAFVDRDTELPRLQEAWASTALGGDPAQKTNVFVIHAIGGGGKSALIRHFVDALADEHFAGAHKVYGWSAYSQGAGDNRTANAEEFIDKALAFFGHDLRRQPIRDPVERGRMLAHLIRNHRSLLILDGLEPLQDPPLINKGRLKDPGLAALIVDLAANNNGLLLITSRQALPELEACKPPRVISRALDRLDKAAGVELLKTLGVQGTRLEMERAVEEVLGHALSLNLLGAYLSAVHAGDVNQREQFKLGEIVDSDADYVGDLTIRYAKRAARIIESAIARFETLDSRIGVNGEAETAILHMVGLFDRPAEREALDALLAEPPIPGLTDAFQDLTAQQRKARWHVAVDRLRKLKLLNAEGPHEPGGLDAHPIVRAHFGARLKARKREAFAKANSRLYDFYRYRGLPEAFRTPETYGLLALLSVQRGDQAAIVSQIGKAHWQDGCLPKHIPRSIINPDWNKLQKVATLIGTVALDDAIKKFLPDDLESMRPCFSAVAHGCAAGRHQDAFLEVYWPRVQRGYQAFVTTKLGALSANLAALGSFFDEAWRIPAKGLPDQVNISVLNHAGFALRALGRLREAVEPFELGLKAAVAVGDWENAVRGVSNVSALRVSLGDLGGAIAARGTNILQADNSGDNFMRMASRTALAGVLHQAGQLHDARALFEEAAAIQAKMLHQPPKLYSARGYRYCDLLLAQGKAQEVIEHYTHLVSVRQPSDPLLEFGLEELLAGRAHAALMYMASRPGNKSCDSHAQLAQTHLDTAVDGLRRAGVEEFLAHGLIARAAFRRSAKNYSAAAVDLLEAEEIVGRGAMTLHNADFHIESARLALAQYSRDASAQKSRLRCVLSHLYNRHAAERKPTTTADYSKAEGHYREAARLVASTGYNRRSAELVALRACLEGTISADRLAPDRDAEGCPAT